MGNWELERQTRGLESAEKVRVTGQGAMDRADGIPLVEYTRASLQPCMRCGVDPREGGRGMGLNRRVVAQVLVMDTVCEKCLTDSEREQMDADIAAAEQEGDDGS